MGYGVFSLLTAAVSLICIYAIMKKGKINIIAGYKNQSSEKNNFSLLGMKLYVSRILASTTAIQLTTGIVCFFSTKTAMLVANLVSMIVVCLVGVSLYNVQLKTNNLIYNKAHIYVTYILSPLSAFLIILLAF